MKSLLIFEGDCLVPLSTLSMRSMLEDLYLKTSCLKCEEYLELTLARKVRPFHDTEQLMPLLERIQAPFMTKIRELLLGGYRHYMERGRRARMAQAPQPGVGPALGRLHNVPAFESEAKLHSFLKSYRFYRYELRVTNEWHELQLWKVGFSQPLLGLLCPEPTDILVNCAPPTFSTVDFYIKYLNHNLVELCSERRSSDWVEDIELKTTDEIAIETRFRNVYYESLQELATVTLFEISPEVVDAIRHIRHDAGEPPSALAKINPEADLFFEKFYSSNNEDRPKKADEEKNRCKFVSLAQRAVPDPSNLCSL